MKETLIIAGFGGQGVLSMGKILAYSGVMQDFEVTWMPSYGPEMRGGTANVTVILSDRKISSPIAYQYDTAIILNQQSMDKFEAKVRPVVEMENVMVGLKKSLPERAWKMLPANEEAIRHGGEIIRKVR